ncbi:MAG: hypothetical protein LBH62_09560, partial [Nitrososphaerota archaeon]|nr:hypothetical protein [Nitrososphaerota archaeon]
VVFWFLHKNLKLQTGHKKLTNQALLQNVYVNYGCMEKKETFEIMVKMLKLVYATKELRIINLRTLAWTNVQMNVLHTKNIIIYFYTVPKHRHRGRHSKLAYKALLFMTLKY